MLLAGGTLAKAQIVGPWPGLDESALYDRRDLMPTTDVRAHAAWAMQNAFGIGRTDLETRVFEGLDMSAPSKLFA